ncbi:hypothetical protein AACH06_25480 [Ideonella sp. DXS29W]|uniref:ABC transporter permease n=1 Tax=Ideonella lacteola TaxID=2984193 RepID=A0ABU9BW48_9BURK
MTREDWMSEKGWRTALRVEKLLQAEQAQRARRRLFAKSVVPTIMMLGLFIAAHLAFKSTGVH